MQNASYQMKLNLDNIPDKYLDNPIHTLKNQEIKDLIMNVIDQNDDIRLIYLNPQYFYHFFQWLDMASHSVNHTRYQIIGRNGTVNFAMRSGDIDTGIELYTDGLKMKWKLQDELEKERKKKHLKNKINNL